MEMLADIVAGRVTGYNPFPNVANFAQTFQIGQAINNTSIGGAIIWGLAELGVIPSKYGAVGKKILIGGAAGGVFDAPGKSPGAGNPTPTGRMSAQGAPSGMVAPAMQTAGGSYFNK